MTDQTLSMLKRFLKGDYSEVDEADMDSPKKIYDKLLELVKPVNNDIGCITDNVIIDMLLRFDYRNATFQEDVDTFCEDMLRLLPAVSSSDNRILCAITAILIYCSNTDLNKKAVNKLINGICEISTVESQSIRQEIDLIAELFQSNVIGSRTLTVDSTSRMMEVVSSADDLLGSCRDNSPINEREKVCCVPKSCMRTPKELGINVDLLKELHQSVIDRKPMNLSDLQVAIKSFDIDASIIDLEEFNPTIYDILNIRFCWWCYWISHWILYTPSEETGRHMLNIVIGCLLLTDKKFKDMDFEFLTLEEMALNCLDYAVNGSSYYTYIRAKNINYTETGGISPARLSSLYEDMYSLQADVSGCLAKYGYHRKSSESATMEGMGFIYSSDKNVNQRNCLEGNGSKRDLYESMSMLQLGELTELMDQSNASVSDIKKLLGESFKLSTMLDAETDRIKSRNC